MQAHITVQQLNDQFGNPSSNYLATACDTQGNIVAIAERKSAGEAYAAVEADLQAMG